MFPASGYRKDSLLLDNMDVSGRKRVLERFPFEVMEWISPVFTEDVIFQGNYAICLAEEKGKKKICFFAGRDGKISPFSNLVKTDSSGHFSAWVTQQKTVPCELADAKREKKI